MRSVHSGVYRNDIEYIQRKEQISMYQILATDGKAKRASFETVHGTIQTPVFMNVGTAAAIKGAVATTDLQ